MEITCITNKEPEFYRLMGPFLAKRSIEKEIGYRIYDDDDKEWFIAFAGEVIGFCYRRETTTGKYQIGSCYVVESHRQKGVFRQLLAEATSGISGTVTLTTKNEHLQRLLLEFGFEAARTRGRYTEYRRDF